MYEKKLPAVGHDHLTDEIPKSSIKSPGRLIYFKHIPGVGGLNRDRGLI